MYSHILMCSYEAAGASQPAQRVYVVDDGDVVDDDTDDDDTKPYSVTLRKMIQLRTPKVCARFDDWSLAEVGKNQRHNQLSLVAPILSSVYIIGVRVLEGVWMDGGILAGDKSSNSNMDLHPFLASHRIFKARLAIVLVKSHVLRRIS